MSAGTGAGYALCLASGSGLCSTLAAMGATDAQLGAVGDGTIPDTQLLDQLTGNYSSPVLPSSDSGTGDAIGEGLNFLTFGALGTADLVGGPSPSAVGNAVATGDVSAATSTVNTVSNTVNAVGNWLASIEAWLSANWIYIVVGLVGVLLLIVWAYGGFHLGFLQG